MSKDELIRILKEYRENNAKLKLRKKELQKKEKQLEELKINESSGISMYGTNESIHSKNKISNSVLNSVISFEKEKKNLESRISDLKTEIGNLEEKVTEAEIRLNSLYFKEREILTAYYVDNRSAEEISRNLYFKLYQRTCSQDNIYDIVKKATKRLVDL